MARGNPQAGKAKLAANQLTQAVMKRVGTTDRNEIKCPREKTAMTPCIARDGHLALADDLTCVACRIDPHTELARITNN